MTNVSALLGGWAAWQQAGYPVTDDVNGFQQEGFGRFDRTTYRGRRWNAARAYVHPVKNRRNLKVRWTPENSGG